jgi:hypothetical protein
MQSSPSFDSFYEHVDARAAPVAAGHFELDGRPASASGFGAGFGSEGLSISGIGEFGGVFGSSPRHDDASRSTTTALIFTMTPHMHTIGHADVRART